MRILAFIALFFWAGALLNIILNLLLFGRLRLTTLARYPFVSIIVPARNEERAIERSVRAFLAQDYPAFEVIVVDDRSTDSTGAILDRIDDSRLLVVRGEEPPEGWLGKPWAMHQGSLHAQGELMLFVDADVIYAPHALSVAIQHNEATGEALTALFPHFEMRGVWENALMPAVPMTPFVLPMWLGEFFPFTWLAVGGGSGNLIRRSAYDAVGGHVTLSDAVVDDVGLAHHVRRNGLKTTMVRADRFVSVRMYHGFREVVEGFTKNSFSVFGRSYVAAVIVLIIYAAVHVSPYAIALTGNKVAIAVLVLIVLTRVVFYSAMRYPIWSALLLHPLTTVGWIWIMIRSTWIVGIRGKLTWRGRTYDPAHTRFGAEPGRRSS